MKYACLVSMLFWGLFSFGQKTPSQSLVKSFFDSETYIVYEGSLFSAYNIYLKDAIDTEWTITPAKIIPYGKFETKRKKANLSFLVLTDAVFTNDKTHTSYNFLNLLLGGDYPTLNDMPDLINIPLSITGQDEDLYVHKLTVIIRFIQKHMLNLQSNPELCEKNVNDIYNVKTQNLSSKTIYLLKEEIDPRLNDLEKIDQSYSGRVIISTREEIEEIISSKKEDSVILHTVGPNSSTGNQKCFKVLIGVDDAEIYYFDHHIVSARKPSCFLKKDLQKIARKN